MDNTVLYGICGVLIILAYIWSRESNSPLVIEKVVLLITAHPDDECMFFGPSVTAMVQAGVTVHILCLSTGNYYGIGDKRRDEFYRSCKRMGVDRSNCHVVDDPLLPDGPTQAWDIDYVIKTFEKYLLHRNISAILTFDDYGVSGHHNHVSVFQAVQKYTNPNFVKYKLSSVNIFRKYASFLDVFITVLSGEKMILTPVGYILKPYVAMFEHKSQLMWFRYLYLLNSRYMFMNTIEQMNKINKRNI